MNGIVEYKLVVRQNLMALIGFCLCFYFCYHLVQGDRSYLRLLVLEKKIDRVEHAYEQKAAERAAIEQKVVMLRPGTLNRDLLEERVRHVLGYVRPEERIIFE